MAYTYRRAITIDHTKVSTSTSLTRLDRSGWSASASSELGANYVAGKAIDTEYGLFWASSNEKPAHLIIDMGSAQIFTHVEVDPRSDNVARIISSWEIYVSDNGTDWGSAIKAGSFATCERQIIALDAAENHRYLKFRVVNQGSDNYVCIRNIWLSNEVTHSDLSNFPVLISGTFAYLAHVDHSGKVQNANGYDIAFSSDAAGETLLKYERQTYNHETGAAIFWVKVPTLSKTSDTVIYLWYGDSGISTDQSDPENVWDTNFSGVWHLEEAGNNPHVDSTPNGNNLTDNEIHYPAQTSGRIGQALVYDGGTGMYTEKTGSFTNFPAASGPLTFEVWFTQLDTNEQSMVGIGQNVAFQRFNLHYAEVGGANLNVEMCSHAHGFPWTRDSNLHHLAASIASGGATYLIRMYLDGVEQRCYPSYQASGTLNVTLGVLNIARPAGASGYWWNGKVDELRLSKSERSPDWIYTGYLNQSNPGAFYSIGDEQGISVANPWYYYAQQ